MVAFYILPTMPSQPTYPSAFTYANPHLAAAIHFCLVKDNRPDDTLLIKPSVHSLRGFTAKYTQNSNATQVEHELANTELMPYINRLFTSMMYDIHRYDSVQIDCPGYSSVVLKTTNVLSYLPILSSQIDSLQNIWPLESIGKRPSTSEPTQGGRENKLDSCMCATSENVNYLITSTTGERRVELIPPVVSSTTRRVTRSSTRSTGRTH